jgi:hypothetical protein
MQGLIASAISSICGQKHWLSTTTASRHDPGNRNDAKGSGALKHPRLRPANRLATGETDRHRKKREQRDGHLEGIRYERRRAICAAINNGDDDVA